MDSMLREFAWPVTNAALASSLGRACDRFLPTSTQIPLGLAIPVYDNFKTSKRRVVVNLALTAGAYFIAHKAHLNAFHVMCGCIMPYENLLSLSIEMFITYDNPINDIASQWRHQLVFVSSYTLTSIVMTRPRAVFGYLLRQGINYHVFPISVTLLGTVGSLIMIRPWYNGFDKLYQLWDVLNLLEGRCIQFRTLMFHRMRLGIRQMCEYLHETMISTAKKLPLDYSSLRTRLFNRNQIRILRLKRRCLVSGLIDASLETIPLGSGIASYEALSYVWGSENSLHRILVNNRSLYITSNLHDLLHARSSIWRERIVWVDAICINQRDDFEKAAQVLRMTDIYKKASRVVAWLGDEYDASMAASKIQFIDSTIRLFPNWDPIDLYNSFRWAQQGPEWQAFVKVIRNPYFSRAWICQEAVLGNNLQFYIGNQYIYWNTVSAAISAVGQPEVQSLFATGWTSETATDQFHELMIFVFSLRQLGPEASHPLGFLLSIFAKLRSKYAVDKVYALRGLTRPALAAAIIPDYTRDEGDVLIDVAATLLQSAEDAIYVLPHAGMTNLPSRLPTWVPDWKNESQKPSAILSMHNSPSMDEFWDLVQVRSLEAAIYPADLIYCASGNSAPAFVVDRNTRTLLLKAVLADTIERTSEPWNPEALNRSPEQRMQWAESAHVIAEEHPLAPDSLEESFWRTLIADRSQEQWPAPQDYARHYRVWRNYLGRAENQPFGAPELDALLQIAYPDADVVERRRFDAYEVLQSVFLYDARFCAACTGRRFAVTLDGAMALVPAATCKGDVVCIVLGLQTPYVLRRLLPAPLGRMYNEYHLVGECYVHGMMDGEIMGQDRDISTLLQIR